jgi:hypothetical protein
MDAVEANELEGVNCGGWREGRHTRSSFQVANKKGKKNKGKKGRKEKWPEEGKERESRLIYYLVVTRGSQGIHY